MLTWQIQAYLTNFKVRPTTLHITHKEMRAIHLPFPYITVHVLLSRFYLDFIQILSRFHPDFIHFLSRFYPDFIQILSRFYPDFIQILSRFYPDFILILSWFFRISQRSHFCLVHSIFRFLVKVTTSILSENDSWFFRILVKVKRKIEWNRHLSRFYPDFIQIFSGFLNNLDKIWIKLFIFSQFASWKRNHNKYSSTNS